MRRYLYPSIPALLVLGIFMLFSNWIPQTRWEPPKKLELGAELTPGELARQGESLVRNRGCLVCHTIEQGVGEKGRGRGPNLWGISSRPRATLAYLVESLYQPGSLVVEGYANIMPPASQPPANLSYEELTAVVAYLQSLGGRPTVRMGDIPRPEGQPPAAPQAPQTAPSATDARGVLDKYGCLVCHALAGAGGELGPALDRPGIDAGLAATGLSLRDYLRQSVADPGAHLVPDFPDIMPKDLADKMSAREMEMLVGYLAEVER